MANLGPRQYSNNPFREVSSHQGIDDMKRRKKTGQRKFDPTKMLYGDQTAEELKRRQQRLDYGEED